MFKKYTKKMLSMILYIALYAFICSVGSLVFYTIANFFKDGLLKSLVLLGAPLAIVLGIVYSKRCSSSEERRAYVEFFQDKIPVSISEEIKYTLKSTSFIAEVLCFATLSIIAVMIMGISFKENIFVMFFASIIMCFLICAMCVIIDCVLWVMVYRKWKKEYRH